MKARTKEQTETRDHGFDLVINRLEQTAYQPDKLIQNPPREVESVTAIILFLDEILNLGFYPGTRLLNSLIIELGRLGKTRELLALQQAAVQIGLADVHTFNLTLQALEGSQISSARLVELVQTAINTYCYDQYTFILALRAVNGRSSLEKNSIQNAITIFQQAHRLCYATTDALNTLFEIMKEGEYIHKFKNALSIASNILTRNRHIADNISYALFLRIIATSSESVETLAYSMFRTASSRFFNKGNNQDKINSYLINSYLKVLLNTYCPNGSNNVLGLLTLAKDRGLQNYNMYADAMRVFAKNSFFNPVIILNVLERYYAEKVKNKDLSSLTHTIEVTAEDVFITATNCINKNTTLSSEEKDQYIKKANEMKQKFIPQAEAISLVPFTDTRPVSDKNILMCREIWKKVGLFSQQQENSQKTTASVKRNIPECKI